MPNNIEPSALSDSGRHGVCSQHYHVQRVQQNGGWLDLQRYDAQLFVLGQRSAMIAVTRHERILNGLVRLQDASGWPALRIGAIEYCISACDGKRVVTQDFLHKFKRGVMLRQMDGGEPWRLQTIQGLLFTLRPLNDILKVSSFGNISGAQFCC